MNTSFSNTEPTTNSTKICITYVYTGDDASIFPQLVLVDNFALLPFLNGTVFMYD